MDRMRESVFATLVSHYGNGDLGGLSFLDLFSGSGVIALEAVSRGAAPVDAVEKDRGKGSVFLKNAGIADTGENGHRIHCHFMATELFLKTAKSQWDIIFLDPPFPYRFHENLVETVAARGLLTDRGLLVMHRPGEKPLGKRIGTENSALEQCDQRVYGRSVVDFFRRSRPPAPGLLPHPGVGS
jgi:16S rRNA (guanine(966)-N(2))-methyltransferase RsmD